MDETCRVRPPEKLSTDATGSVHSGSVLRRSSPGLKQANSSDHDERCGYSSGGPLLEEDPFDSRRPDCAHENEHSADGALARHVPARPNRGQGHRRTHWLVDREGSQACDVVRPG
jgi:hypothetical protein